MSERDKERADRYEEALREIEKVIKRHNEVGEWSSFLDDIGEIVSKALHPQQAEEKK